ncbi:hypothetical protein [Rhodococcus qingshengii]|uniref:hypothetical protein n=1 Tax=Rhodococcus qingshengii TaxID=334542 RepID=UPI0028DBDB7D|nr:hypothetical protein [uncultured Rhodococcus sp.]
MKLREEYLIQTDIWVGKRSSEVVELQGMIGSEIDGLFASPHRKASTSEMLWSNMLPTTLRRNRKPRPQQSPATGI